MKRKLSICVILFVLGVQGFDAMAQFYEPPEYESIRMRSFYAGFVFNDFTPRPSNVQADSAVITFNRIMPMVGFRQGLLDVVFGYAQYTLHGRNRSTIFLGATISNELRLLGNKPSALVLPLMFSSDYTKAEGSGAERDNFNITSVGVGAGLKYRYYTDGIDLSVSATELLMYSFEGLSAGSGFSAATLGETLVVLRDFLLLDGLLLGYRFRYQLWSMNSSRFDYRSVSHGPFLGVLF